MTPLMAFAGESDAEGTAGEVPAAVTASEESVTGENTDGEDPNAEDPNADDPNAEDPATDDPVTEDPAAGEPLIDEFGESGIMLNYDELFPEDDPHFKDGTFSVSFRVESGLVYSIVPSVDDSNTYDEIKAEYTVKKGETVLDTATTDDYCYALFAGSGGVQAGDIITVSLKKAVSKQASYFISVDRYEPYTKSAFPSSVTVGLNKTREDIDETDDASDYGRYYWADYSIADPSIADIKVIYYSDAVSLNVTGRKPGVTTITATLPNGRAKTCKLTVSGALQYTKKTIRIKESFKNQVLGYSGKVTWTSSNKKVATVSSKGVIKGVKKGTATITAKAGKKTYKCTVKVLNPVLSKSTIRPMIGQTYKLSVIGGNGKITWSSSKKSIATVSSTGVVKAKREGTATVTATRNGVKITCKVIVSDGLVLSADSADLLIGGDGKKEGFTLSALSGFGDVTWTSDDESIATVTNKDGKGYVEPVDEGFAFITATRDGYTEECIINVTKADNISYAAPSEWSSIDVTDSMCMGTDGTNDGWFIKFRPQKTGYITVTAKKGAAFIHLRNKNNKVVSDDTNSYIDADEDASLHFGVRAGTYYYLAVENVDGSAYALSDEQDNEYGEPFCRLSITNTKVTNKCGYTKGSAKTLKKNTVVKGALFAGEKKAHWYKFKLTKPAYIRLKFNNKVYPWSYITIYQGNKIAKGGGPHDILYPTTEDFWTDRKMAAGTYYIRIKPDTDFSGSGWYSIKWW